MRDSLQESLELMKCPDELLKTIWERQASNFGSRRLRGYNRTRNSSVRHLIQVTTDCRKTPKTHLDMNLNVNRPFLDCKANKGGSRLRLFLRMMSASEPKMKISQSHAPSPFQLSQDPPPQGYLSQVFSSNSNVLDR